MNQNGNNQDSYHIPAMAREVSELVSQALPGLVVDATFGGGGHSERLLADYEGDVEIVGIDRDPQAVSNGERIGVTVLLGNFRDLADLAAGFSQVPVAVVFDFGVSSRQLEDADRGFSYRLDGPLSMQMGPDAVLDAATIINQWPEKQLAEVLHRFGEEPMARRIARSIVPARPINSTAQLSTVIVGALPPSRRRVGHPARRSFQALRIAVNDELGAAKEGLEQAIDLVAPGGRIIAISYHSLEDRLVKDRFAQGAAGCVCPSDLPVCGCEADVELRVLTRKPIRASEDEVAANRRSRSALLRAVEKVAA